jgi:hypothetical protein
MEQQQQRFVIVVTTHRILRMDIVSGETWTLVLHDHADDEWHKVGEPEETQEAEGKD